MEVSNAVRTDEVSPNRESDWVDIYRSLCSYFQRKGIDPDTAEDLTQEGLIRILQNPDVSHFEHWLSRVASNLTIDHYRRRTREKRFVEDYREQRQTAHRPDPYSGDEENRSSLRKLLPPNYSEVLILIYDGKKSDEIARQLNIPKGTVFSRLSYARGHIKDNLYVQKALGINI